MTSNVYIVRGEVRINDVEREPDYVFDSEPTKDDILRILRPLTFYPHRAIDHWFEVSNDQCEYDPRFLDIDVLVSKRPSDQDIHGAVDHGENLIKTFAKIFAEFHGTNDRKEMAIYESLALSEMANNNYYNPSEFSVIIISNNKVTVKSALSYFPDNGQGCVSGT
jgi:hypothetical protein